MHIKATIKGFFRKVLQKNCAGLNSQGQHNNPAQAAQAAQAARRLATGDWRLATGDWRLATGDWRLATGG